MLNIRIIYNKFDCMPVWVCVYVCKSASKYLRNINIFYRCLEINLLLYAYVCAYTYLNDSVVSGRYDLCELASSIGVPQKSLKNDRVILLTPITSLFKDIAGISSCTKLPLIPFRYTITAMKLISAYA